MVQRLMALLFVGILMFSANPALADEDEEDEFGFVEEEQAAQEQAQAESEDEESGSGEMVTEVKDPAVIKGKVTFDGQGPKPKKIKMDADPTCMVMHSEPVFRKEVLISEDGSFANVFVYVKEGLGGMKFPKPDGAAKFDQIGCEYTPRVFGVRAGQPIEIINSDATLHNVHAIAKENDDFNIGMPVKGMKLKKTFNKPETMVKMVCDVHPWMNGYVGVMTHPYFFTTGKDGVFELPNLPPGEYTIAAWQEKLGEITQKIKVGPNETKEISFVFTRPKK